MYLRITAVTVSIVLILCRYGWFVTLGAFICLFWTAGLVKSYGVLFAEMMSIYPEEIK